MVVLPPAILAHSSLGTPARICAKICRDGGKGGTSQIGRDLVGEHNLALAANCGRTSLPTDKRYATISRFAEDASAWLQEAWSIVLEFDEPPSAQGNPSMARARFLAKKAPVDRLKPDR